MILGEGGESGCWIILVRCYTQDYFGGTHEAMVRTGILQGQWLNEAGSMTRMTATTRNSLS